VILPINTTTVDGAASLVVHALDQHGNINYFEDRETELEVQSPVRLANATLQFSSGIASGIAFSHRPGRFLVNVAANTALVNVNTASTQYATFQPGKRLLSHVKKALLVPEYLPPSSCDTPPPTSPISCK
jgi:hypothetical protein